MEFCFGLLQTSGSKRSASWISLTLLYSMLCMWTSVECWSYYYSNDTMNWSQARAWCREHYTDMVAIQNQEEIGHLNTWLPRKSTYYWIGIRKINDVWTWVGTNKALTPEATNWAVGEPNNGKKRKRGGLNEDCVEMYIKREQQPGKWNDERCEKTKTALCYTAACKNDSCIQGECVETINSHKCECFEGFYGERCEHAVQCPALQDPENGHVSCSDNKDMRYTYGFTCSFSCVPGYKLVGPSKVTCTSSAEWNEGMPRCEAITCQNPEGEAHLIPRCSHPELRPDSTCSFSCEAGFELQGADSIKCSENGQWTKAIPTCKAMGCPAPEVQTRVGVSCTPSLSSPVSAGTPYPLGIVCTFSCDEGNELQGALSMECVRSGQWTFTPPTCIAKRCPLLESPENGHVNCSNSEPVYNSQCSFTCNQDFSLDGHDLLTCDRHGNWTGEIPNCQAPASQTPAIASGLAAGGGVLTLSGLSAALWVLKRLRRKATKFELNSTSDIEDPPQVYKNSIDSLI
ncbi:E-selectin-like isoform X2 [Scomber scombrus]|uniref:E-selectin-like isoform X2 n=1 Tax=Scomber scombrus TaxID=13677 RepID=UPI002DD93069|nr:E-selectin-like isoform X2 [Scomber scombrus]